MDPTKGNEVDPWSHFVNVFLLDKDGNRIARRNPQDIFTPLYNNQIPPGAGQTVHYKLQVPEEVTGPITVNVKLQYRKFDQKYMDFVAKQNKELGQTIRGYEEGKPYQNDLPITTLAVDEVTFPTSGEGQTVSPREKIPEWQRWNDYGIGLLLKGKAELRQANEAFTRVENLGRFDGPINLARSYEIEGSDLGQAIAALQRAYKYRDEEGFPRWTWNWLNGKVKAQEGDLESAEADLRSALDSTPPEMRAKGFDFSLDYEVRNLLGEVMLNRGSQLSRQGKTDEARKVWEQAIAEYEKTLALDSENVAAHFNLQRLHESLGNEEKAEEHRQLHQKFKPEENTASALQKARVRYPAANHAAEAVVIYDLQRKDEGQKSVAEDQSGE
jgi:tetratricopeptide (TPR) repeat protein